VLNIVNEVNNPPTNTGLKNDLRFEINNGVDGRIATRVSLTTSGTGANVVLRHTLSAGTLTKVGQGFVLRVWGVNSADANAKTLTLNWGSQNVTAVVTASGALWYAEFNIVKSGANTQEVMSFGQQGTTTIAVTRLAGTRTDTADILINLTATAATAGTMTIYAAQLEQVR
jgi:hypothetical protein